MPRLPTAVTALRRIAAGEMTAETYIRSCLERIEAREPSVGAWHVLGAEAALAEARRIDRLAVAPPMRGIPVGVKDVIDTAELPTGYGSALYEGFRPHRDASCVALTRKSGGIILGKTVTTEFAFYQPGKTVNPKDTTRTPGGSSSGSAAAVADGMVPLAFGTQTAGSVIRPASFCGCVGYKPSAGLLDRTGMRPLAESQDTVGLFSMDVADAAWFVSLLAGRPALRLGGELAAPRIGLCRTHEWPAASADSQRVVERAAGLFAAAGAKVTEVTIPAELSGLAEAQATIMAYEVVRASAPEMLTVPDQVSAKLKAIVAQGEAISPETYDAARALAGRARHVMPRVMADVDVVLAPAAPGEAPVGLDSTGDPIFNRIWTLLGMPCLTLPGLTGSNGMPIGVQLIARRDEDARLLRAAAWCEARLRG